jgi:hypothetical protein
VEPESDGGAARLSLGASELGVDDEEEDAEEESPGVISAFGVPSPELETARRNRGGPPSLLLDEDELLEELFEALLAELLELLSELELARRSLGRSGSLSLDERELVELSSELDDGARRSAGLFGLEPTEELLLELLDEDDDADFEDELSDDRGSGLMSSVCREASECSSAVPSLTIEIVEAL